MAEKAKRKLSLTIKILIGFAAGVIIGLILDLILGDRAASITGTYIQPFGTLFLNLIKMVIVPLVFTSLVVGACGLGDIKSMGRIGGKTIVYFLCTTAIAVIIGLIIGNLFQLGVGGGFDTKGLEYTPKETSGAVATLLAIIPTNPFASLASGDMLPIIAFALFVGGSIVVVGKKADSVRSFFDGFSEIMYSMTGGVMKLAPYAVFALMMNVTTTYGPTILGKLAILIVAVYLACILHAVIVYSAVIKVFGKYSPIRFFKNMIPALAFAFSSASSAATLPFTMEGARKCGVPHRIRSFVLPLGATINMDGTAAFQACCALFIANIFGMPLNLTQQLEVILAATLASIGTAGVPGAGTIMLGMVLAQVGLPVEGIAIIIGVDRILDMIRTTINICGDAACSIAIARSENELLPEGAESVPAA